ncbi:uncharacterized protein [Callorhinus ursinus]|uniref:uncharacterized protein n=1 Tax=Callorhinus ursinus TaxID=34884 RepID=UPI003CD003B4
MNLPPPTSAAPQWYCVERAEAVSCSSFCDPAHCGHIAVGGECNSAGPFVCGKIWTFKSASPGGIIGLETDLKQAVIYRTHQIRGLFLAFSYRVPMATERADVRLATLRAPYSPSLHRSQLDLHSCAGCQILHKYVFDERFWARLQVPIPPGRPRPAPAPRPHRGLNPRPPTAWRGEVGRARRGGAGKARRAGRGGALSRGRFSRSRGRGPERGKPGSGRVRRVAADGPMSAGRAGLAAGCPGARGAGRAHG